MNTEKIRAGISSWDIIALVFLILGAVFAAVSAVSALNMDALRAANGTGDPRVLPVVFGAIGIPFLVLGAVFAALSVRRRAGMRRAVRSGDSVLADVAAIRTNFSLQINGQYPCVLECHYRDPVTGALHIFKSRNLFFYPGELEGRQIRVFVDRGNMKHYYVDVEDLIPSVQIH